MLFNSLDFIGFLIIIIPLYFIIPHKFRWVLLLVASYFFYMSWNAGYGALILFTTAVNYAMARLMEKAGTHRAKKTYLLIGLISSLAVLFGFKYLNFVISIVNGTLQLVHADFALTPLNILLPVGISFFTLQTLSYTIDVYLGKTPVEKHFGIFALYVSFFPQLVAGPIERSENLLPQFYEKHTFDPDRFRTGVYQMLGGFFMKMVVADRLAMNVNAVYSAPESFTGLAVLIATCSFALQIYCDFAGYSLIALGTAEILGFRLMQNFKSPYLATNIQMFWSRWHISLTSWLRDYIYIPLGGSHKGVPRQYLNILLVFAISGLWHGASFAFILWGVLHAVYQIIERATRPIVTPLVTHNNKGIRGVSLTVSYAITLASVVLAWVFFRSATLSKAILVFKQMFTAGGEHTMKALFAGLDSPDRTASFIAVGVLILAEIFNSRKSLVDWLEARPMALRHTFMVLAIMVIIVFGVYGDNVVTQFIYFQF